MVLVFAEHQHGQFKKAAQEAVYYGSQTASLLGTDCLALVTGEATDLAQLGNYGATRVLQVANPGLQSFDSEVYTAVIAQVIEQYGVKVCIFNHSSTGKSLLGRLAARFTAGSVAGVNALPVVEGDSFKVNKLVFSGKAIATYEIKSDLKLLSLTTNVIAPQATAATAEVEQVTVDVPSSRVQVQSVDTIEGEVPLPEAEVVVSAGRGMKGPENWGIVEDLAHILGATTACSRPVADVGWRPHHEHVGQTGVVIRPNLYIAIGISGAIQHLAGVNGSKVIVAINKDPEAPFFKAADYGVVGDLFDVVPRLNEALRAYKRK